jgi:hypothetical protein
MQCEDGTGKCLILGVKKKFSEPEMPHSLMMLGNTWQELLYTK